MVSPQRASRLQEGQLSCTFHEVKARNFQQNVFDFNFKSRDIFLDFKSMHWKVDYSKFPNLDIDQLLYKQKP